MTGANRIACWCKWRNWRNDNAYVRKILVLLAHNATHLRSRAWKVDLRKTNTFMKIQLSFRRSKPNTSRNIIFLLVSRHVSLHHMGLFLLLKIKCLRYSIFLNINEAAYMTKILKLYHNIYNAVLLVFNGVWDHRWFLKIKSKFMFHQRSATFLRIIKMANFKSALLSLNIYFISISYVWQWFCRFPR